MAVGIDTQIGLMHDVLQNPIIVSQTQLRCLYTNYIVACSSEWYN